MALVLGPVDFADYEIPEEINFGGRQKLEIHELIGGGRVVDAYGPSEADIHWQGRFRGRGAAGRARTLDALRMAGAALPLMWGGMFRMVVIESFDAQYQRPYEIPYSISCVVVLDPLSAAASAAGGLVATVTSLVKSDVSALRELGGAL